jgi:DNA polymerase III subunit delta
MPALAHAGLGAALKRGMGSLYTLHGDEALLVQEAADAIRSAARGQGYTERSVHIVQGAHFDWGAVLAAGQSMSLFAERQLLEVRVPSGKPGKDGSVALQRLAELSVGYTDTLTLLILPRLDKPTRSSGWFSALEQHGACVAIEPIDRHALPGWIAQRLARHGLKMQDGEAGQEALRRFADCVEGNLLAAHQEVEKLALLHASGSTLGPHDVEQAVRDVARFDTFALSGAVLAGDVARVQRMLDGLAAAGEAEVLAHYALAEDIRALKRVKDALAQGRPLPVALREQRVWGERERAFERVVPRLSAALIDRLLIDAHTVDGIVKGLKHPEWPHDGWGALQRLGTRLARQCARAARA